MQGIHQVDESLFLSIVIKGFLQFPMKRILYYFRIPMGLKNQVVSKGGIGYNI